MHGPDFKSRYQTAAFSQIRQMNRIDDRVSIVNGAFANLIGMNLGLVEFSSDQDPPSRSELLAWAWLLDPENNPPRVEAGANAYFVELVQERYAPNNS